MTIDPSTQQNSGTTFQNQSIAALDAGNEITRRFLSVFLSPGQSDPEQYEDVISTFYKSGGSLTPAITEHLGLLLARASEISSEDCLESSEIGKKVTALLRHPDIIADKESLPLYEKIFSLPNTENIFCLNMFYQHAESYDARPEDCVKAGFGLPQIEGMERILRSECIWDSFQEDPSCNTSIFIKGTANIFIAAVDRILCVFSQFEAKDIRNQAQSSRAFLLGALRQRSAEETVKLLLHRNGEEQV